MAEIRVEDNVAAPPSVVYDLVSDVTRMGEWSPETTSCRWLAGATGPVVGARFRGSNRQGWRRWSTTCTVVEAEPGVRFAFDVDFGSLPVSRWRYDFVTDGGGCRVIESWTDRRPAWLVKISPMVMGVADRDGHNREGMRTTLSALRKAAEAAASASG